MQRVELAEPIRTTLPEYPGVFTVTGFRRDRNGGPVLTMADATQEVPGIRSPMLARDIVTQMRLADLLSNHHTYPVNAANLYGPRGRRCDVGRTPEV